MSNKTNLSLPLQRLNSLVQSCLSMTEQLNDALDQTVASVIPAQATVIGVDVKTPVLAFGGLGSDGGANWQ